MDSSHVRFASARFEELKADILSAVKKTGFTHNVTVIPASGLLGDNVAERGENMPWYKGLTKETEKKKQAPKIPDEVNH